MQIPVDTYAFAIIIRLRQLFIIFIQCCATQIPNQTKFLVQKNIFPYGQYEICQFLVIEKPMYCLNDIVFSFILFESTHEVCKANPFFLTISMLTMIKFIINQK
jgi:hypothetical protein